MSETMMTAVAGGMLTLLGIVVTKLYDARTARRVAEAQQRAAIIQAETQRLADIAQAEAQQQVAEAQQHAADVQAEAKARDELWRELAATRERVGVLEGRVNDLVNDLRVERDNTSRLRLALLEVAVTARACRHSAMCPILASGVVPPEPVDSTGQHQARPEEG